ncbi:RNA 2',3'-cyclic phosphodiesterase [Sporosarcina koreensis]|uniref:RNA 2',3'-cyclic phosphodiesterase n=1 Tax=Sporosarcina koreensis TaxID=334735 RepID=UPI0006943FDF|nr:RNA 2',3'-cyclic phosphodiesterase [Sporosarcina koreensis]
MAHYFAAIPIPFDLIAGTIRELNSRYDFPSHYKVIPHRNDYHITLIFFGALTDDEKHSAENALRTAAAETPPFTIRIDGLSFFGNPSGPRVVTLSTEQNQQLTSLYESAGSRLDGMLAKPLRHPYVPHVTIAKKTIDKRPLPVEKEQFTPLAHHVTSITLFRIEPSQSPKYVPVSVYPLQGMQPVSIRPGGPY